MGCWRLFRCLFCCKVGRDGILGCRRRLMWMVWRGFVKGLWCMKCLSIRDRRLSILNGWILFITHFSLLNSFFMLRFFITNFSALFTHFVDFYFFLSVFYLVWKLLNLLSISHLKILWIISSSIIYCFVFRQVLRLFMQRLLCTQYHMTFFKWNIWRWYCFLIVRSWCGG